MISRFHYGWIVLAFGVLVVFGALGLARFGYTMLLPDMQEGLDIENTRAGALATSGLIGYLALSVIGGALASRFGPRIVISVGLSLAAIGMLLTGLANSFVMAMIFQFVSGMGSGAANISMGGLLASWFAPRKLGLASGILVSGSSVGLIFSGLVAPPILDWGEDGWRVCWYLFSGITFLLAIVGYLVLRNRPEEKGLLTVGSTGNDSTAIERSHGLQWGKVYRSSAVWHIGLVYVAFGMSYIIYMTFFSKQLIAEGGYTDDSAGNLFMIMGGISLFCGLIWGTISDRIGRKYALAGVYLMHVAAFSLFGLWTETAGFVLAVILFGLSAWSIPAIMTAACGDILGPRLAPAALGFITLFFGIGQAIGPSVAGAMADAADSFLPAYLFAAGVALLGSMGALRLKTSKPVTDSV